MRKYQYLILPTIVVILMLCAKTISAGGSTNPPLTTNTGEQIKITQQTSADTIPNEQSNINSNQDNNLTPKDWQSILAGAMLGWILSILSVWLVDKLKEPNLVFDVGSVGEDNDPARKWRFIHIKIRNIKRKFPFGLFMPLVVSSCKVIIRLGGKKITGRWSSKGQPLVFSPHGTALNLNEALVVPREDIIPTELGDDEEAVEVPLGIKYEGDAKFYLFNNESYIYSPSFKYPQRDFGIGEHLGEIIVLSQGKKYSQKFKVHNESSKRKDFWLELIK